MGRGGKWTHFKMLLELPISEVLLEGKGEESAEGEREAEWWEKIVKSSPKILSKWEKRSTTLGRWVPKLPVEGKGAWYHPREAGYVLM